METLYAPLKSIHSTIAYLALFLIFLALFNAFIGLMTKRMFKPTDRAISLFGLIIAHVQLVVGLLLWFVSPVGLAGLSQMKESAIRLTALEHPLTNILAIVFITIGWSKHKKEESHNGKYKKIVLFYALGLLLLLSRIPWKQWAAF
jgi:NADH:ubiquinone oxidoreductase subunit 2 (subunit N)